MNIQPVGLFAQHPLQGVLHHTPQANITHNCPVCNKEFTGNVRAVLYEYREHVFDTHLYELEEDACGCCGGYHFPSFTGDCREDWERF